MVERRARSLVKQRQSKTPSGGLETGGVLLLGTTQGAVPSRVLIDFGKDRPWSQYFCCMAAANRDFTRKHPVATKRALRAMLKATDLCASQPERAARLMVDKGVADKYQYVLQSGKEIGFQWRV